MQLIHILYYKAVYCTQGHIILNVKGSFKKPIASFAFNYVLCLVLVHQYALRLPLHSTTCCKPVILKKYSLLQYAFSNFQLTGDENATILTAAATVRATVVPIFDGHTCTNFPA